MSSEKVKVGIVGLGLVAHSHLKGYRTHPYAEVGAVCDVNNDRARHVADENGIEKVYTEYEALLNDEEIDVIDIATPTFLHSDMAREASAAGKHVHCEKPFCRFTGEGLAACRAAAENKVLLMVGETYVFLSSHIKARELIDGGEIGRPLQIRQRHGAWLEKEVFESENISIKRKWRIHPEQSGGGEFPWIFDHAVHFFASAEYLLGDIPVDEVFALTADNRNLQSGRGASHDPYSTAETDIPIISWKHADPACHAVWMRAERLNSKYDYMRGFSTTVIGERGVVEVLGEGGGGLVCGGKEQHLVLHREGRDPVGFRFDEGGDDVWRSEISYYSRGHINQIHHFLDCLQAGTSTRYPGEMGVRAVRATLAAIRSAKENRPVKLDEIGEDYKAYA